jgi:homocysteine S-methyltransferase
MTSNKPWGVPLLSDGGLETTLVFHLGLDLPGFAAFDLLQRTSSAGLGEGGHSWTVQQS